MSHKIYTGLHILNVSLGSKNTPSAQLGDVLAQPVAQNGQELPPGEAEIQNANWMQHVGFCSLPSNAIAGQSAAESMYFRDTNTDVVFASRDIRSNAIYGSLGAGETAIFGSGADGQSQGIIKIKNDGSLNLNTTNGNTSGGVALGITISANNNIVAKVDTGGTVYLGDNTVAAKNLAYATPVNDLLGVVLKLAAFANGIAPGTISAGEIGSLTADLLNYSTTKTKAS